MRSPSSAPKPSSGVSSSGRCGPAGIPLYSSVTGELVVGEELTAAYWGRDLRHAVPFHPAIERIAADGYRLLPEMSANPTLVVAIQQALDELGDGGRAFGR